MTTRKIKLKDDLGRVIRVNTDATDGAVMGVNLRWPDGRLVTADDFAAGPAPTGGAIPQNVTTWESVLQRPANVRAVEAMTGTGVVTRDSVGTLRGKALVQGANINITEDANNITVAAPGIPRMAAIMARISLGV